MSPEDKNHAQKQLRCPGSGERNTRTHAHARIYTRTHAHMHAHRNEQDHKNQNLAETRITQLQRNYIKAYFCFSETTLLLIMCLRYRI